MTMSVFPFLRLVSVCGAALMGSSCLPMFGAGQVLAGSSLAEGLLPSSSLELVWRGDIRSFPSSGLRTPRGFKVSPADSYSLLMEARPGIAGEWACYHDRSNYHWAFVAGLDALIKSLETTASEIIGVASYEQCKGFVETLSRYQKFTDIRNVGAAIHSMIQNANERMDEVGFNEEEE